MYTRGKHGQKWKERGITAAAFLYYFSAGSTGKEMNRNSVRRLLNKPYKAH